MFSFHIHLLDCAGLFFFLKFGVEFHYYTLYFFVTPEVVVVLTLHLLMFLGFCEQSFSYMLDNVSISYLLLQNVDGVNYFHVKVAGLLFVATSRVNVSPSLILELLQRIVRVAKDYLGVLNEESLRKNFVLVYELLDEMIVSIFL